MPVVEDLRDMWKVTKLQRERKAKQEQELALKEQQALKEASGGSKVSCIADLLLCVCTLVIIEIKGQTISGKDTYGHLLRGEYWL